MENEKIIKAWTADDLGTLNPLDIQKGSVTLDSPEIKADVKAYNSHAASMWIMKKHFTKKFRFIVVINCIFHFLASFTMLLLPFLNEEERKNCTNVLLFKWTGNAPLCVFVWVTIVAIMVYVVFIKKRLSPIFTIPISVVMWSTYNTYIFLCIFNVLMCMEIKPMYDELSADVGFPAFSDVKGFAPSFGEEKYTEGYSRGDGVFEDVQYETPETQEIQETQ